MMFRTGRHSNACYARQYPFMVKEVCIANKKAWPGHTPEPRCAPREKGGSVDSWLSPVQQRLPRRSGE